MTETQVVTFDVTKAAIAEMSKLYMPLVITDLDDKEQINAVHNARMVVRSKRILVDKKRKELKAEALAWGKLVQGKANEIFELIEPIESHLKAEENKAAEEKKRIKDERNAAIKEKLNALLSLRIVDPRLLSVIDIEQTIISVEEWKIEPEEYFKFTTEANELKTEILIQNAKMLELRVGLDKEEAERKAESERLAKVKAEQNRIAAEQAEAQAKIDEQNRKIQAEKNALEAEKKAEQDRIEREEFERNVTIQAEKNAKEKADREAQEKVAREKAAKEAAIREEMLKPDREKLIGFAQYLSGELTYPNVESAEAKAVLGLTYNALQGLSKSIYEQAQNI